MINVKVAYKNLNALDLTEQELTVIIAQLETGAQWCAGQIISALSFKKPTHSEKISVGHIRSSMNANLELKAKLEKLRKKNRGY